MPSRDFETVEVFGKTLIYDIQIEEMQYRFLGQNVKTTKWLHLEDWLQLYEQLEERFSKCTSADLPEFTGDAIEISNRILAQVEKRHLDDFHRKLFADSDRDLSSICLRIRVKPQNVKDVKEPTTDIDDEDHKHDDHSTVCSEKAHISDEEEPKNEYIPSTKIDTLPSMPYNPSKAEDVTFIDEPYSPRPLNFPDEEDKERGVDKPYSSTSQKVEYCNVVYKPSVITKDFQERSSDFPSKSKKTDKSRKRSSKSIMKPSEHSRSPADENRSNSARSDKEHNNKSRRTEDLFGTDDSDVDSKTWSEEVRRKSKKSKKSKKSTSTSRHGTPKDDSYGSYLPVSSKMTKFEKQSDSISYSKSKESDEKGK